MVLNPFRPAAAGSRDTVSGLTAAFTGRGAAPPTTSWASLSLRLFHGFTPCRSATHSLAQTSRGLAFLPAPTFPWLLVPRAPLQIPENAITQDQSLEKSDGPLYTPVAHGDFQGAVMRRPTVRKGCAISVLSTSEGHLSSRYASMRPKAASLETKKATRLGSSRRCPKSRNRLNLRQKGL